VAGVSGPTQLFELRRRSEVADRFTFSPMLNLYPFARVQCDFIQGLGLGVGSTLFQGGDLQFLKEWNMRLVYELPFAQDVLIAVGPSVRNVRSPAPFRKAP
jgi:hypothetical protein